MSAKAISLGLLSGAIALALFGPAGAQAPPPPQGPAPQAYRPGLGDLMTTTVQPRHTKLGIAGQERNWAYAAYELHELQESFDRASRLWPVYRKTNIAELLPATMKQPMDAVAEAIKSADPGKFNEAYARLTASCNACHQSTERAVVVIQVPKVSSFPDQDFRPPKP